MTITSKKITEILNISDSTLRKWCLALEKRNYVFKRDSRNQRIFNEADISFLKYFKQLVQENGLLIQDAVIIVINKSNKESPILIPNSNKVNLLSQEEFIDEMLQMIRIARGFIERQEKINEELLFQIESEFKKTDKQQAELKLHILRCIKESEERLFKLLKNEFDSLIIGEEMKLQQKEDRDNSILNKLFGGLR